MSEGKFSVMIDQIIPIEKVLADAKAFLDECGWELEIEDSMITIPKAMSALTVGLDYTIE
mgnify:CR=1 FL=1